MLFLLMIRKWHAILRLFGKKCKKHTDKEPEMDDTIRRIWKCIKKC
jgi:hypothetical protein